MQYKVANPCLHGVSQVVEQWWNGRLKAAAFFNPWRTLADMKVLCGSITTHASHELGCSGHFQYPEQKSRDAKCLLFLKLLSSASIIGIGHCLLIVAAFTGLRSIVLQNLAFETLGTKSGAACHAAWGHGLIKFKATSSEKY